MNYTRPGWSWFRAVIRHAAIDAHRRYQRWGREVLTLNHETEDEGEEWGERLESTWAEQDFVEKEFLLFLEQVLPRQQFLVLYELFARGKTESEVAKEFHVSQQHVSRLKKKALQTLRGEWIKNEA